MIKYILIFLIPISIFSQEKIKSNIDLKVNQLSLNIECRLIISSGYRTYKHNKKIGGTKNSYHLNNLARDLVKSKKCKKTYMQIGIEAKKLFQGVIIYNNHIHVDLRKKKYFVIIK